jgi:hypothetical protein
MLSPEEARENVAKAIVDLVEALGWNDDKDMLSEYGIIAAWTPLDANGSTLYSTHFHSDSVPEHVAIGLFTHACNIIIEEPDYQGEY